MKFAWIAGRFLFLALVVGATILSMGSAYPFEIFNTDQPRETLASISAREFEENQLANSTDQESAKSSKKDFDLAATLEAKGWKDPKFVLFVTGRQHGYIEPCGCITLERQKGGLMRRDAVRQNLVAKGWEVIPIDAGNQIRRLGNQPELKIGSTYQALCKAMKYEVIGVGPDDAKLAGYNLGQKMDNAKNNSKNPFTCANLEILMPGWVNPYTFVKRNGKQVGVTMVLGDEYLKDVVKDDIKTAKAADALKVVSRKMQDAKSDMNVLIAFTSLDNCRELAKSFPLYDLLITAGGAGDPTLEPELIVDGRGGGTSMIQVGVKGMYVGLVGYFVDAEGKPSIKYERVQLDSRFDDSPAIKDIFRSYQETLKQRWETKTLADIRPRLHATGHSFIGSDACADCHSEEYDIWKDGVDGDGGPHSEATADLKTNPNDDRVWLERQFDPECVSCHATGWNPQNFYPYKTGYMDYEKHDMLHGNGCENCHGPGSAHVEIQRAVDKGKKVDEAEQARLALQMRVTLEEARATACMECHDLDNSPDFLLEGGFDKYWPQIEHGGDDD
ncbi:MAG: multiheme c-type cytochrome [Mariniblastus sp.]